MLGESAVAARARAQSPTRDFTRRAQGEAGRWAPAVIGEIKRASPSRGVLRENFRCRCDREELRSGGRRLSSV